MKNLIKCHFYYLVSRTSIAVVGLVVVILGCSFVAYSKASNESMGFVARMMEYTQSSMLMVRILLSFLLGFLFAHCFEGRNDHYSYFLLTNITRRTYVLSKLFLLFVFGVFVTSLLCFFYVLVGLVFIPGFNLYQSSVELFLVVLLQGVLSGLYCVLCIQVFHHMMVIFIPFVLLLFSLSMDYEAGGLTRIFLWLFPKGDIPFSFSLVLLHLLLLISLLVVVNVGIYEKRDLNY